MMNTSKYVIIVLATLTMLVSAIAQDQPPMRGPAAKRIEQFKKIRLMEILQMNDETSIRFFSRYNKHLDNMRGIGKDRNELIDNLKKLRDSNADDAEINKVIKDINVSEGKVSEERSRFIKELRDVLSTKQIAEFIIFERNFNQNLRELMRDITQERWNRQRGKEGKE